MQSIWRVTVFLCCVWFATLIYGEMLAFWVPYWRCQWPVLKQVQSAWQKWNTRDILIQMIAIDCDIHYTNNGSLEDNLTFTSWNFIQNVSTDEKPLPRVLLTHIPLYRPNDTPCGAYRSSPIINQRISSARSSYQRIMYQNYLSGETSTRLLELIKPILVLSGHDHDQCTVSHPTPNGPVTEHTVGTFSWQQGNLYPSFMLLSVSALSSSKATNLEATVSSHLCFLPMQTHIYLWYACLFVLTLVVLLAWPTNGVDFHYYLKRFTELVVTAVGTKPKSGTKEKDEDVNWEYEMVWDAEGVMHLIRKGYSKVSSGNSGDIRPSGRGTAVARPAAKKQIAESDSSCVVIETDTKSEQIPKGPRMAKGKMGYIVQRLIRLLSHIAVIASVNVPLYVMLLTKDWT